MIGDHDTAVLMHNDGVVQGLAEVPFMQDVDRWGVLTIGTGLGNARFTNRRKENGKATRRTTTRTRSQRVRERSAKESAHARCREAVAALLAMTMQQVTLTG